MHADRETQIPGRSQFKHVVFGPQLWPDAAADADAAAHFPAIRDAVLSGNWTLAQSAVDSATRVLRQAAANLAQ